MTEVITNPIYDEFLLLCAESRKSIRLCAPYVKEEIVSDLLNAKCNGVVTELITKINLQDYHSHASDLDAVRKTLQSGGRVFNCSNLHAKVYVFDDCKCIITSANLTSSGLKRNVECGLLTDEIAIVNSALVFYKRMLEREDVGEINERKVNDISKLLLRIPPIPHIKYPRIDLPTNADRHLSAIADGLSGWKKDVFLSLGQFGESFTSDEVRAMAQQLQARYPNNNNREAKIRQILQQLRDLGLVEFSSPGVYRKLWI